MLSDPPDSLTASSPWPHVREGVRDALGIPALVLMASLVGVGGLCRDIGFPMGAGVLSTLMIWAAPGQMVMFGAIGSGAALPAVAIAVSLSSIRFLPMCMALLPLLRGPKTPLWLMLLLSHYVAVTAWVQGMRVLPDMPQEKRIPYYLGFANTVMFAAAFSTGAGYFLVGELPISLAAAALFTSPLFFTLSMLAAARRAVDWLSLVLGFILAPLVFRFVPSGLDLLVQGMLAGSLAYLAHRILRKREVRRG